MPACARMGDPHACPITGHGITPIIMGSPNTYFDGQPAACVGHKTACGATIVVGFPKFTVNGLPVAYMGSPTTHGGLVIAGSPDIFAASMGGNPIDFQKMGAIDEAGELDKTKMAELLADPGLESKALMAGATVNLEAQTFHFLDPVMSIFQRRAAEIPTLSTTMARLSKQLKNEGNKLLDAENPEQGPPTKEEQDEKQLIVQVVGKEHNDDQRILICDEGGNKLGKTEERSKEPFSYQNSKTETESIDNELHIWPWPKDEPERVLKLEVQAICGGPIELPLMDKAIATYKRTARQSNVICPVVPASLVENARPSPIEGKEGNRAINSVLAKTRTGYLYIFNHGKLWRELEIRQEEQEGKITTYHDVRLSAHREGPSPDAPFKEPSGEDKGIREVEGKGLKDIWLPIQWNQRRQQIEVMYTEAQIPAARLNRFERDPKLRKRRTQPIDLNIIEARVEHEKYRRDIILGDCMPKVRPRSPIEEWEFDFPAAHLLSLHGAHPFQAYKKAETYQLGNMKPKQYTDHYGYVEKDYGIGYQGMNEKFAERVIARHYKKEEPHIESSALAIHIQEALLKEKTLNQKAGSPKKKRTPEEIKAAKLEDKQKKAQDNQEKEDVKKDRSFWTDGKHVTIAEAEEAFFDARTRKIGVIQVEDPLYRARHLKERLIENKNLLELLGALSESRPHYKSALLMDRYLAPKKIAGQKNPYYTDFESISEEGRRRLGYTLTKTERALISKYILEVQDGLATWIKAHLHHYALADLFSMSGVDYMGAFKLTIELIQWASMPLHVINSIDGDITQRDTTKGQKWLYQLVTQRSAPLFEMLFPETSLEILQQPYIVPEQDENLGDGVFRGAEVAKLMAMPKFEEPAETIDGMLLSSLDPVNDLTFSWLKNYNGFLALLYSNFSQIISESIDAATGIQKKIQTNGSQLKKIKASIPGASDLLRRAKGKEANKLKRLLIDHGREWIDLNQVNINLQRSCFPHELKDLILKIVQEGEDLNDYYLVTLQDLSGPNEAKSLYAKVHYSAQAYDLNAKPLGSSQGLDDFNKEFFNNSDLSPQHVMVIKKSNKTLINQVKKINELHTQRIQYEGSIKTLNEQIKHIHHNTPYLKRLLEKAEVEKARVEKIIQEDEVLPRIKGNIYLPSIISAIEVINLYCNEIEPRNENIEFKGKVRTNLGLLGAALDTVVALEVLAAKTIEGNIFSKMMAVGKDTPPSWWRSKIPFLSYDFAEKLVRRLTVGTVVGAAAGFLALTTSVMDTCTEWNRRNYGAAVGYAMISTAALIGLGSLFFAIKPGLAVASIPYIGGFLGVLFSNPPALLVIGLVIGGTALIMAFDNSQLELWLSNGPFSTKPNQSNHKHLTQNEDESFYRLFILLVKPSIEIRVNPLPPEAFDGPNAVVRVNNPLSSMGAEIDEKDTLNVVIRHSTCRAHHGLGHTYHMNDRSLNKCTVSTDVKVPILKVVAHADYNEYYVRIMSGCNERMCPHSDAKRRNRIDHLKVWAQAYYRTNEGGVEYTRISPGLDPTDKTRTLTIDDIQDHTKEASKKFWVTEDKNQAKKALQDYLNELEKELEPA